MELSQTIRIDASPNSYILLLEQDCNRIEQQFGHGLPDAGFSYIYFSWEQNISTKFRLALEGKQGGRSADEGSVRAHGSGR